MPNIFVFFIVINSRNLCQVCLKVSKLAKHVWNRFPRSLIIWPSVYLYKYVFIFIWVRHLLMGSALVVCKKWQQTAWHHLLISSVTNKHWVFENVNRWRERHFLAGRRWSKTDKTSTVLQLLLLIKEEIQEQRANNFSDHCV